MRVKSLRLSTSVKSASLETRSDLRSVHTTPEKLENAALYFIPTVRPSVHTYPSRKRNFSKILFKPEEFKNRRDLIRKRRLCVLMWTKTY